MNISKITDANVSNYIRDNIEKKFQNNFEKFFYEKIKKLEESAIENYVPIIQKDSLDILLYLIKDLKPKNILELGTAIGYSSILFNYVGKCKIDTLERDEDMYSQALKNIKDFGMEKDINVIKGEILDSFKILKEENKTYDFIFIDAGKSHYQTYLENSLEVLTEGGLIVCDNILFDGKVCQEEITDKKNKTIIQRMKKFISDVYENDELESTLIANGDGLLLIKRKESKNKICQK